MRITALVMLMALSTPVFAFKLTATGRIVDLKGEGVHGVTVTVPIPNMKPIRVKTNKKGVFTAIGVQTDDRGYVTMTMEKEGYITKEYSYEHKKTREVFTVQMIREGSTVADVTDRPLLSGVIKDSKGNPVPEVELTFSVDGLPDFEQKKVTGADGRFEIPGIANGLVKVYAVKKDYRDQIYLANMDEDPLEIKDFKIQTLDEAYAEMGLERPEEQKKTPEQLAVDLYNEAVDPFQNKNYDVAEQLAKKAIELDPNQAQSLKLLVFSNYHLEDWPETLAFAERFLEKNEDKNILNIAAHAAQASGKKKKFEQLSAVLKKDEVVTPDSLFTDAVKALNRNDDATASEILKKILKMDPNYADAYKEMGKIKVREFEFEDAIHQLKLFLKHAPKTHREYKEIQSLIVTLAE